MDRLPSCSFENLPELRLARCLQHCRFVATFYSHVRAAVPALWFPVRLYAGLIPYLNKKILSSCFYRIANYKNCATDSTVTPFTST